MGGARPGGKAGRTDEARARNRVLVPLRRCHHAWRDRGASAPLLRAEDAGTSAVQRDRRRARSKAPTWIRCRWDCPDSRESHPATVVCEMEPDIAVPWRLIRRIWTSRSDPTIHGDDLVWAERRRVGRHGRGAGPKQGSEGLELILRVHIERATATNEAICRAG
jgi:hypothetical protein